MGEKTGILVRLRVILGGKTVSFLKDASQMFGKNDKEAYQGNFWEKSHDRFSI